MAQGYSCGGEEGNFVRLERAAFVRGGLVQNYVLFELHGRDRPSMERQRHCDPGPILLRLERQGDRVIGSFSTDGRSWVQLEPWPFDSRKARVGVAAVNTSSRPYWTRFEDFRLLGR